MPCLPTLGHGTKQKSAKYTLKSRNQILIEHACGRGVRYIGVARGGQGRSRGPGPPPPPIKIPLTTKSYDNIAWRCLVAVFFSVITHITVINNNINDKK